MFLRLDTDNDGTLSIQELKNGMGVILTFFNIDESELMDMVRKVDTNNDGVIDKFELKKILDAVNETDKPYEMEQVE